MKFFKKKNKKIKEYPRFITPLSDFTFKTLWVLGDKSVKEFLNRIIYNVVGFSIRDFYLASNELGILSYKSIANKVDTLLISPDNKVKVNVEMNRFKTDTLINKNNSYLLKMGGESYAGEEEKYAFNISVSQVNVNTFKSPFDPEYTINEYGFYNKKTMTERMNVKIFDIALPNEKNPCYDISEEFKKDLAMFSAKNYEEMERLAKGNKEREAVMGFLKRLGSDPEFVDYYDHEEYEEALKAELTNQAYNKGLEEGEVKGRASGLAEGRASGLAEGRASGLTEGHASGLVEGQSNIIKNMSANNFSVEEISKMTNISVEEVKTLLNKNS